MIKDSYTTKDFLPLIVIFAFILLFSISLSGGDYMVGMRMFMGGFFVVFGLLKLLRLNAFAEAYQMYDILAMRSKVYAYIYPFIELGLGIAFLVNFKPLLTNQMTLVVMLVGAIGVYLKLRKKEKIMCACLGTVFKVPMTWVTLFEDLLMALMAVVMIIAMQGGSVVSDLSHLTQDVDQVQKMQVVELSDGDAFDMEASIVSQEVGNRTVKRLAYNGQIPGPVLKVEKDAKVTINFTNNLDMETALHSHGLRGDYLMDGAVPITPAIEIGESFSYELVFPDAGVFWYHPHVREDYQQDMGLYGNFIVTEDGYWNEVNNEEYLIVDDILEDGEYDREVVTNTLMGRFGNKLLINDTDDYNLSVKQGEITRAFITNVANTRTFKLEFEGAQMKLVGGDTGRIEKEEIIDHQIIGTSERYVIELYYDTPGTYSIVHRGETMGTVTVEASDTDRKEDFMVLRSNAADYVDIRSNISSLVAKSPDKNLRLDIAMKGMMNDMMMGGVSMGEDTDGMVNLMGVDMTREGAIEHCQMMPSMDGCEPYFDAESEMGGMMGIESSEVVHGEGGIEWEDDMAMMNDMSTDDTIEWFIEDSDTKKRNGDIDWSFNQGDLVKIRIFNDDKGIHPMQHPIHFHGQKFVVLTRDGEVNENLQWKDSVLIPTGQTVDLLIDMSNPGLWMAHCHIAEHLHAGMMFGFEVK